MARTKRARIISKLDRFAKQYARIRDCDARGFGKCISCQKTLHYSKLHGGHYIKCGNLATRWDKQNINAECAGCNTFDIDHLIGYRKNLIDKIGTQSVEGLEDKRNNLVKIPINELEALATELSDDLAEIKALKNFDSWTEGG